jgi:hypothetical protein
MVRLAVSFPRRGGGIQVIMADSRARPIFHDLFLGRAWAGPGPGPGRAGP